MESTAHGRLNPRFLQLLTLALALFGEGCAAFTSAGPVGPLRSGSTTQLEAASAYAYGPATATIGNFVVKGNGQEQAAGVPLTVGIRQSLGATVEVSADVATNDSGLRLRVGLPSGPGGPGGPSVPLVLSFEARDGQIAVASTRSYQGSLAFEIYPDITPANSYPQRRLILSLGIAGGVFAHQLSSPYTADPDGYLFFGGPTMTIARPEVRLQTAVGIYLADGKSEGLSIVVAPWFLLSSEAPTSFTCTGCGNNPPLTSFSQSWGASLIFTPSYGWLHGL